MRLQGTMEIKDNVLMDKKLLRAFHDDVLNTYLEVFKDEKNVLFKMKEVWSYMIYIFSDNKKYAKQIRKCQKLNEYKQIVSSLFIEQDIVEGAGLFCK